MAYTQAFQTIHSTLFYVNPTIVEIQELWHKFEDMRLFDMESLITKGGAFELKAFRTTLVQKFEKAHEKLMTR